MPPRQPPTATDFTRVTTRYLIAAREWANCNRETAGEALERAVVVWPGRFWITFWKWRGHHPVAGTADRLGHGAEYQTTMDRYGNWLADGSRGTYPKGQAVSTTLARSRSRGHSDDECLLRSGVLMDSDDCGGWQSSRQLFHDVGLSFVGQMRPITPDRCHLEIPLWPPLVPERDESGVATWKRDFYQPRLGWTLGILSELAGLRYEPSWDESGHASAKYAGFDPCCDQLTHLCHVYTRRPDDPNDHFPVTNWELGGALDVNALTTLTEFETARAQLGRQAPPLRRTATAAKPAISRSPRAHSIGTEEIDPKMELLVGLRRLRNPDSQKLLDLCLQGQSYATIGERNNAMWKIACIVASKDPHYDPNELAKIVFERSLTTMATLPGAEPATGYVKMHLAQAAKMIARAQERVRAGALP